MAPISRAKKTEMNRFEMDWQQELQQNITTVSELEDFLPLSTEERKNLEEVATRHPMNKPR